MRVTREDIMIWSSGRDEEREGIGGKCKTRRSDVPECKCDWAEKVEVRR